jgi:hypothetical protein
MRKLHAILKKTRYYGDLGDLDRRYRIKIVQ